MRSDGAGLLGRVQPVRELAELADEIRVVEHAPLEADAAEPLHEHAQRPIGDADHLVSARRGPDAVEIVPARSLGLALVAYAHRDEREQAVAADDVVDQL